MSRAFVFSTLLLGLLGCASAEVEGNFYPVKVSVYYSVMCPNCRGFITAKMASYYEDLKPWMELEFVPFGNSTQNDDFKFTCPEGPDECLANKWHACANALYSGSRPELLFKFINCTLWRDDRYFENFYKCANQNYLDFLPIQHCVNTFEGLIHLAANAEKTSAHLPKITSFPTIDFNGTFNQELQDLAVKDFKKALCSQIKDPETQAIPRACRSATAGLVPAMMLLIFCFSLLKLY